MSRLEKIFPVDGETFLDSLDLARKWTRILTIWVLTALLGGSTLSVTNQNPAVGGVVDLNIEIRELRV